MPADPHALFKEELLVTLRNAQQLPDVEDCATSCFANLLIFQRMSQYLSYFLHGEPSSSMTMAFAMLSCCVVARL